MTEASTYAKDSIIGVTSKLIKLVGGYGTLWLLTDILSDESYGGYVTAVAIISLFALLAQAGLRQATIQRVGELSVTDERDITRYIGAAIAWVGIITTVITVGTWLLLPAFSPFINPVLLRWIRLLTLIIPGMALLPICGGALRGLERVSTAIVLEQIAVQVIRLPCLAAAWLYWRDPAPVALALGLAYYLPVAAFAIRTAGWRHLNFSGLSFSHLRYSGYLMLNSIASRFLKKTDVLLLASLATLSATGGYNVAWKLAIIARYGDQILTNTLQPRISKYLAAGDIKQLQREFNQVRDLSVVAFIPILIIILLFGESLLSIFGDYTGQFRVLLILTIGAGINASFGTIGQILLMGKEGRLILINTLISLVGNILLNFLLIPQYGAVGAALATTLTVFFLTNLVAAVEVKYYLHIDTFDLMTPILVLLLSVSVVATIFEIIPVLLTTVLSLTIAGTLVYRRYTFVSEVFRAYRTSF